MAPRIFILLAAAAGIFASAAHAADEQPAASVGAPRKDSESYIVTLGAMGAVAPSFPGSALLRPYPFPTIGFRKADEPERFSTPDEGFGIPLVDKDGIRMGPVANFVFRRGNRDGLYGVHQVGLTHEIGGFAEYSTLDHFRTRAELRQGIDGHEGFVAALGADFYNKASAFTLSLGPRLNFGNNAYANSYFSVSPGEAELNGRLQPYQAQGGFTAAGGLATIRYDITPNFNATVFGGLQRLTGSVGASPIPNLIGSRDQFTAGLSFNRSFEVQKFW
jgi:outer membrane scaffolding protein for murein synthesis (MipA/OmpV family)